MRTFYSVDEVADNMANGALAIGNFDGVHLGHQALIKRALEVKGKYNSGVLTFSPHPREILKKNHYTYLSTDEDKVRLLSRLGLDVVIVQHVNRAFLALSPHHFVENILVKKLGIKQVVVGHDFTFGDKAQGNVELLQKLGPKFGFSVHIVPEVIVNNARCSSSAIRQLLSMGKISEANAMLGRHYSLKGPVLAGNKLGRQLGFSTANLKPFSGFGVRRGIYATITRAFLAQGLFKDYLSATNVGVRPTVTDDDVLLVESHCLDSNPDLYGKIIEVFFVEYIREEEKFASLMELTEQVQKDCLMIRQMFHEHPRPFQVEG